jgi:hypothetical protein
MGARPRDPSALDHAWTGARSTTVSRWMRGCNGWGIVGHDSSSNGAGRAALTSVDLGVM